MDAPEDAASRWFAAARRWCSRPSGPPV